MGKNPFGEKKQIAIITYYYDTALVKIQFSLRVTAFRQSQSVS